jgi:xeroderma pigmentosum group C-complementing protein
VYNLLYSSLTQAFAEEDERQKAEEKKRDEAQALRRWYQLLSSIVTRQRLKNRYNNNLTSEVTNDVQCINDNVSSAAVCDSNDKNQTPRQHQMEKRDIDLDTSLSIPAKDHEHVFLKEYESFDKETSLLTKRCQCGFSVQVEEL